ncbi:MAG TPA: choice-of-anchor D domain-containing protein, partial [Myxococcota bacterium]
MTCIAAVCALVSAVGAACGDTQFITVHDQDPKRPVGQACEVDASCSSGRCIEGICKDDGCTSDADCRDSELCVFDSCQPEGSFACQPDQAPIINVGPSLSLDYGDVALGQSVDQIVTVKNTGDCLLTLSGVDLGQGGSPDFACTPCDAGHYPQRIPPQQELDITVTYAPTTPGDASGSLLIHGDDTTAGDAGLVTVDLHADYDGIPALVIEPTALDFGYVPFTAGGQQGSVTESVTITNRGTGNAALVIDRLFIDHGVNFTLDPAFDAYSPDTPLTIAPYDPNDASTTVTVAITFTPDSNDDFADRLIVRDDQDNTVPVDLTGSSKGPPEISVTTADLTYKCGVDGPIPADPNCDSNNLAYAVGIVTARQFTISNNTGQSPLTVNLSFGGDADDFTVSPTFIPPIPPGGQELVSIFYAPSSPSDLGSPFNPTHAVDAVLNITSNDTDPGTDVLKTVALHGFAKGGQNDQLLKLEMNYENADNSWAGNDFRDVDLELENPHGLSCKKPLIPMVSDGNGGSTPDFLHEHDFCDEWNTAGEDGHSSWVALGAYEEPERIVVSNLGPTTDEGGIFTARVYYMEDCANIPTGLLADLLGIGGSILLGVLGAGIGVPVAVPPDQISNLIANNCFDHSGSTVTLHITLDGTDVADPQHRLEHKGDVFEMAHLKRTSGQFCD